MLKLRAWSETAIRYLWDVKSELHKVTFPSRKETIASTAVVIAAVGIISIYLGIVDFVLARMLRNILR